MARIRSIHPKILESEDVASWSPWAQLAWTKIWLVMDDKGRVKDSPQWLASVLFAFNDDQTATEMRGYIDEWVRSGVVCRYEDDGKHYLHAVKWAEFQRPQKPTPTKLPTCPRHDYDSPMVALQEGYIYGKGGGGGGGGGEGGGGGRASYARSSAQRCPKHKTDSQPPNCRACKEAREEWERLHLDAKPGLVIDLDGMRRG